MGAISSELAVGICILLAAVAILVMCLFVNFIVRRFGHTLASKDDLRWMLDYKELRDINKNTRRDR